MDTYLGNSIKEQKRHYESSTPAYGPPKRMRDFSIPKKPGKSSPANRSGSQSKCSSGKNRNSPPTEIRRDLVKKFRRVLKEGAYEVKAEEIADKIVQKIREEKDRIIS
ncbi:MAG: flagellar biosynthesis anti-sigma factor FlgM [Nitrospinales bacterium]